MHVHLQNKNMIFWLVTDIGTPFSSGHEANADEYHET